MNASRISTAMGGARSRADDAFAAARHTEVMAALLDSNTVQLQGFIAERKPMQWLRLDRQFVSPDGVGSVELTEHLESRRRNSRVVFFVTGWVVTLLGAAALSALLFRGASPQSTMSPGSPIAAPTPMEWKVESIGQGYLLMDLAGAKMRVLVGQKLPNGEVLGATLPSQGTYFTNTATVVVSSLATPTPVGSAQAPSASVVGSVTTPFTAPLTGPKVAP